jgi:hypothetical protein
MLSNKLSHHLKTPSGPIVTTKYCYTSGSSEAASTVYAINPSVTASANRACQNKYGARPIPLYDGKGKPACCGPVRNYIRNGQVEQCPPAKRTGPSSGGIIARSPGSGRKQEAASAPEDDAGGQGGDFENEEQGGSPEGEDQGEDAGNEEQEQGGDFES